MDIFITMYFGLVGLMIGSFLNVVIYRLPHGETIVHGRSHCPNCGHSLSGLDLVPVFSFLFLGRRCRYCKAPISWRYMIIELSVGIFFTAAAAFIKPWAGTAELIGAVMACTLFCVLLEDAMIHYDGHDTLATRLFWIAAGTVGVTWVIEAILRLSSLIPWWDRLIGLAAGLLLLTLPGLSTPKAEPVNGSTGRKRYPAAPIATTMPIAGLSLGSTGALPVLAVGGILYLLLLATRQKQPSGRGSAWLGRLLPLLVLTTYTITLFIGYI